MNPEATPNPWLVILAFSFFGIMGVVYAVLFVQAIRQRARRIRELARSDPESGSPPES